MRNTNIFLICLIGTFSTFNIKLIGSLCCSLFSYELCFYPEKTTGARESKQSKRVVESNDSKTTTEIKELQSDLEKYSKALQQVVLKLDGRNTQDVNNLDGMYWLSFTTILTFFSLYAQGKVIGLGSVKLKHLSDNVFFTVS